MKQVKLGKITAPVGIKGEFRVFSYLDELTRFSHMKKLIMDGTVYEISSARYMKGMAVLKLAGINDRNAAELLRGKELFLAEGEMWEVPEDTYFIDDLIGLKAVSESGEALGVLSDVVSGAQDRYKISDENGNSFYVPAVKEFIKKVDVENSEIVIHLIEGLKDIQA